MKKLRTLWAIFVTSARWTLYRAGLYLSAAIWLPFRLVRDVIKAIDTFFRPREWWFLAPLAIIVYFWDFKLHWQIARERRERERQARRRRPV